MRQEVRHCLIKTLFAVTVGGTLLASSVMATDPLFGARFDYDLDENPTSVCSADLDGDGDYDLAVTRLNPSRVSILKNYGNGRFAPPIDYSVGIPKSVGGNSKSVFAADLDGDGDYDLAVANDYAGSISILKNKGDGSFSSAVVYSVAVSRPFSFLSVDLDGDDDLDMAVTNLGQDVNEPSVVSIMTNSGDGSFAPAGVYTVGVENLSLIGADLDGDGDHDLAVTNEDPWVSEPGVVSIMTNNGDGSFAPAAEYGVGLSPWDLCTADLDGDGDYDLAVANWSSGKVSILKNNGDGSFAPAGVYHAGFGPCSVIPVDLDIDNDYDLVIVLFHRGSVSILKNDGDGSFGPKEEYTVGREPREAISADLDGDGDYDLVLAVREEDKISILTNQTIPGGCCTGFSMGNVDCQGIVDVGDVTAVIESLFITLQRPCCFDEADLDFSGLVDVGDLTMLITSLYITLDPLPECPY